MGKYRGIDDSEAWISREFAALWKALKQERSAKRSQAAEVSSGGITVKYPDGKTAARYGLFTSVGGNPMYGLQSGTEAGRVIFAAFASVDSSFTNGMFQVGTGDGGVEPSGYVNLDTLYLYTAHGTFISDTGSGAGISASAGGTAAVLVTTGSASSFAIQNSSFAAGVGTTASGANLYIDPTNGLVSRSTSSRRYKQDIATAEVDTEAALKLTPRRFRSKAEVEERGDEAPEHVGFIAEEAADLGLDAWVTSDDEGPESFSYATWCVAQQAIAREQAETIRDQAEQIKALTARIEALEGKQQP